MSLPRGWVLGSPPKQNGSSQLEAEGKTSHILGGIIHLLVHLQIITSLLVALAPPQPAPTRQETQLKAYVIWRAMFMSGFKTNGTVIMMVLLAMVVVGVQGSALKTLAIQTITLAIVSTACCVGAAGTTARRAYVLRSVATTAPRPSSTPTGVASSDRSTDY